MRGFTDALCIKRRNIMHVVCPITDKACKNPARCGSTDGCHKIQRLPDDDAASIGLQPVEPAPTIPLPSSPELNAVIRKDRETSNGYATREQWLVALMERFTAWFEPEYTVPKNIRISCGFPSGRAIPKENGKFALGQCFGSERSADEHFEIFISPVQSDALKVAATVAHEMCHAVVGIAAKHGKLFKAAATRMLVEGKMTATVGSDAFATSIARILDDLGPYPHADLDPRKMTDGKKKQTTRLLKAECPMCQYTVRITRKWLDDVGSPHCPNHGPMDVDDAQATE
jgi:SprT-like family